MNASLRVALEIAKATSEYVNQASKEIVLNAKNLEFVVKVTDPPLNQYAKAKNLLVPQTARLQDKF